MKDKWPVRWMRRLLCDHVPSNYWASNQSIQNSASWWHFHFPVRCICIYFHFISFFFMIRSFNFWTSPWCLPTFPDQQPLVVFWLLDRKIRSWSSPLWQLSSWMSRPVTAWCSHLSPYETAPETMVEGTHMGVSINGGTPKWMVYNGKSDWCSILGAWVCLSSSTTEMGWLPPWLSCFTGVETVTNQFMLIGHDDTFW